MSKKSIALLTLLFVAPVLVYFLWPSDEARIRTLFRDGARAIEKQNIDDVMSKVSFNYTDEHGLSYLYLKKLMERAFHEVKDIRVDYEIKKIEIKGDSATADVDVTVVATRGTDTGYILGNAARPLLIRFILDKERMKWLINRTEGLPRWF
ncbi:MAG: hypothetical protein P8Z71_09140 [Candidatus Sulfobium sp.]